MASIVAKLIDNLGKGLNLFARDTMTLETECVIADNIWSVGKNSIAKRMGTKLLATISAVSNINGLATFYNGATRELLAMAGGKIYKVHTGTAAQIGSTTWTSGLRTDFTQAGGKVFITNGTDVLREYNGTAISDTTNGQKGTMLLYYKGCLWTAGDPAYPTRLYRSGADTKLGDFVYNVSTNPLATSIFVGKDDGQNISGIFKHQDYLYVAKERSLWRVTQAADASGTLSLELIDPSRGTDAHQTLDTVENDQFMFNEMGLFATGYEPSIIDQIRTNIISLRIDDKIKSIQKSRLGQVCGIYHDNHYYLSITSGGGTYNDRIMLYDRQRLSFWEWHLNANCFASYKNTSGETHLHYGSSTDGKIYYFDETATLDDGVIMESVWKSPRYVLGDYFQEKFFLQALLYFGSTPGIVTIEVYIDGRLHKSKQVTLGDNGTSGIGVAALGTEVIGVGGGSLYEDTGGGSVPIKIPTNKTGRDIQIVVREETSGSFELNAIEFLYKPLAKIYQPGAK